MEARMVTDANYAVTLLPGKGIVRRLSWRNVSSAAGLVVAFVQSLRIVWSARPHVIVGVGGYASVPCALAGVCLRVPLVVLNIDAVPGAANRLLGHFARAIAVARPYPKMRGAVVTGVPVHGNVLGMLGTDDGRENARRAFALDTERIVIVITGGSLGARRLNEAGIGLARLLGKRSDLVLYHVSGERDYDVTSHEASELHLDGAKGLDYRLVSFESRLFELFQAADIVICRAGASTLAELSLVGVASVLVPLPGAPSDHQEKNAEPLTRVGGAIVVNDAEATPDHLAEVLAPLLKDPSRRVEMSNRARSLGVKDAAERVARLIDDTAQHRFATQASDKADAALGLWTENPSNDAGTTS
jgi:UDP-N-acetylglucosamine:LPS N-acetylglucosamine transferase